MLWMESLFKASADAGRRSLTSNGPITTWPLIRVGELMISILDHRRYGLLVIASLLLDKAYAFCHKFRYESRARCLLVNCNLVFWSNELVPTKPGK